MTLIPLQDYWRAGLRRAFDLSRAMAEYRILDVLQEVDNPTLLLSCELDPITPCGWVEKLSEKMLNAVHYALKKAAHTANYSATEIMSRSVLRYLLIQDDDGMRQAGKDIFESVTRINETREAAASRDAIYLDGNYCSDSLLSSLHGSAPSPDGSSSRGFCRWRQ